MFLIVRLSFKHDGLSFCDFIYLIRSLFLYKVQLVIWLVYIFNSTIDFQMDYLSQYCESLLFEFDFLLFFRVSSQVRIRSPERYMTFWCTIIYSDTRHQSDITPIVDLVIELDLVTKLDHSNELKRYRWNICYWCMPREDTYFVSYWIWIIDNKIIVIERNKKRSDTVLWQKPLHPQKNPKTTW